MKKTIFSALMVALAVVSFSSQAAGFDCSRARSFVENAICDDATLSALDDALNAAFSQALQNSDNPNALKKQQSQWLKNVRNACDTNSCLVNVYSQRIRVLQSM